MPHDRPLDWTSFSNWIARAAVDLSPGRVYCEVGELHAETLVAALARTETLAYAVETTQGEATDARLATVSAELSRRQLDDRVFLLQHDIDGFFDDLTQLEPEERVGLYCYGGATDYRSVLVGLLRVKPFLSDRALMAVVGASPTLHQAIADFLATHPEARSLADPISGVTLLAWDATQPQPPDAAAYFQNRQEAVVLGMAELGQAGDRYDRALKYHQAGRLAEAEPLYRQLLQDEPERLEAWLNLGMLYVAANRAQAAVRAFQTAASLDDTSATAHYGMGLAWERLEQGDRAIAAYETALTCPQPLLDSYNNLGNLYRQRGEFERAERLYRQAIQANPQHAGSYLNLSHVLNQQQRLEAAIAVCETALMQLPDPTELRDTRDRLLDAQDDPVPFYLGLAYAALNAGQVGAATRQYRQLVRQNAHPTAYLGLALSLQRQSEFAAAISVLREGVAAFPLHADLWLNLTTSLRDDGDWQGALETAAAGREALPDCDEMFVLERLLLPLFYGAEGDIETARSRFAAGLQEVRQRANLSPSAIAQSSVFFLAYQGRDDRALMEQYGDWVRSLVASHTPELASELAPANPSGKLHVAFASVSMGDSRLGEFYRGWLRRLNRDEFRLSLYYLGQRVTDFTQEFAQLQAVDFYHVPQGWEAAAQRIAGDRPDVLVYPDVGISTPVTQLAALRLAPVQCTTWAHPVTTGLPTVDYFLSSAAMEPPEGAQQYRETLVTLPQIGFSVTRPQVPPLRRDRADFGLGSDRTVYLSCQTLSKYLPQHDRLFPAIARRVPSAQFAFIAHPHPKVAALFWERLSQAFAAEDLSAEAFCVLVPRLQERDYLALNQLSDVFLDTLGWSGGVTTLKAIACELPVVTCPGETMRSRHSFGILQTLGVTETIAASPQEYVEVAVRLGLAEDWRRDIVARMQRQGDRLYDEPTCVAALEAFLREVGRSRATS